MSRSGAPQPRPGATPGTVRLYHYTHKGNIGPILESGVLKRTESNITLRTKHPDSVVWLLCRPIKPGEEHGLTIAKTKVRLMVDVPSQSVFRWQKWAPRQLGSDSRSMRQIVESGGGEDQARLWWVSTEPIPRQSWVGLTIDGIEAEML